MLPALLIRVGDRRAPGEVVRLGLRHNASQFALLVGVNAMVGGMVGQERTILPLLARDVFGLTALSASLTYLVAFGIVKAVTNFFAGTLGDRFGRKPVLVAGWVIGTPVPFLLMWGQSWIWIIVANVLLGVNQGLTWSMTVIMKIDLVGPSRRGLAMGLNEASGYVAVAATALATGFIAARYGLRPDPFYLGIAFAGLGLSASLLFVHETRAHTAEEMRVHRATEDTEAPTTSQVFWLTSVRNRSLSAASQAGLVNNLNDGLAWGVLPTYYASHGLSIGDIGVLSAVYPAVWGIAQLVTGALSDHWGRKWLISTGMVVQGMAIAVIALVPHFTAWMLAAATLGLGTAMVYPTLIAAIGDVAHPSWRARSIGVYRLFRDGGFAVGAVVAGFVADRWGLGAAIMTVAVLTVASGLVVAIRMVETFPSTARGLSA